MTGKHSAGPQIRSTDWSLSAAAVGLRSLNGQRAARLTPHKLPARFGPSETRRQLMRRNRRPETKVRVATPARCKQGAGTTRFFPGSRSRGGKQPRARDWLAALPGYLSNSLFGPVARFLGCSERDSVLHRLTVQVGRKLWRQATLSGQMPMTAAFS